MLEQNPSSEPGKKSEPKADLNAIFDLDRKKLTRKMVDRFEEVLRQKQSAAEDEKAITGECVEAQFKPNEIKAMKKHAQLRVKDQAVSAREQLGALDKIGKIIGQDLFDFAGIDG